MLSFSVRGRRRTGLGPYLVLVQCGWEARGRGGDKRGREDVASRAIFQGRWLNLQAFGSAQNGLDHHQKGWGYFRPLSVSSRGSTQNCEQNTWCHSEQTAISTWHGRSGVYGWLPIGPGLIFSAHPSASNMITLIKYLLYASKGSRCF